MLAWCYTWTSMTFSRWLSRSLTCRLGVKCGRPQSRLRGKQLVAATSMTQLAKSRPLARRQCPSLCLDPRPRCHHSSPDWFTIKSHDSFLKSDWITLGDDNGFGLLTHWTMAKSWHGGWQKLHDLLVLLENDTAVLLENSNCWTDVQFMSRYFSMSSNFLPTRLTYKFAGPNVRTSIYIWSFGQLINGCVTLFQYLIGLQI